MASAACTSTATTVLGSTSPWCAAMAWMTSVAFIVFLGKIRADVHVRAFDLVVDGLADVVQQAGALGQRDVHAQLGGHHAGTGAETSMRMLQHVLAVAGAVAHAAQQA